jgi:hypothetical protein
MTPEETTVGMRVRVRDEHRRSWLRGKTGTIVSRWGGNHYVVALYLRLDDGDRQVFWAHELEQIDGPA